MQYINTFWNTQVYQAIECVRNYGESRQAQIKQKDNNSSKSAKNEYNKNNSNKTQNTKINGTFF